MKPMKITIDKEACGACDVCADSAPNTFEMGDDAKARVKDPTGDSKEIILEAAENCPMSAITVQDADTGAQLYPKA